MLTSANTSSTKTGLQTRLLFDVRKSITLTVPFKSCLIISNIPVPYGLKYFTARTKTNASTKLTPFGGICRSWNYLKRPLSMPTTASLATILSWTSVLLGVFSQWFVPITLPKLIYPELHKMPYKHVSVEILLKSSEDKVSLKLKCSIS